MREDIVGFLNLFKSCLLMDRWGIKHREKNRQALIDLDISPDERRDVLLGLQPEDYITGPKPDDTDSAKEVWEFGKKVNGQETYIKLRVVKPPGKQGVFHGLVWSFHPAEFPPKYPLRRGAL